MSLSQFIAIILILASVALGVLGIWPKYKQFAKLSDVLNLKKRELVELEIYFDKLKTIKEKLEPYQDQLAIIDSALPERLSVPEFFLYLQTEAERNGLLLGELKDPTLKESEIKPNLKEIFFDISVTGTYPAFKNFLLSLWQNAKLIEVDSISFSSEEKKLTGKQPKEELISGRIFNFNLKLKTYGYSIY